MIGSMLRRAIEMRIDDVLRVAGLARRRPMADYLVAAGACFVSGAVVGGALALLFAPSTGEELRTRLNERVRAAGERLRERAGSGGYQSASNSAS